MVERTGKYESSLSGNLKKICEFAGKITIASVAVLGIFGVELGGGK